MLQTIHDKLKGIFAVAILVALGVVFVFWGVSFNTDSGGLTRARGVEVNGREIPVAEVQGKYQDELSRTQSMMGAAGVPDELRKLIQKRVLDQAVQAELLRQRTGKLGFQATDAEILETIRQVPAFQVEGRFSPDAYHAALRSNGLTPERFEAEQRQYVLARQLDRGLYASAFVLPAEFARATALRDEVRTIGWVEIPASRFESIVQLDDDAVRKHYEANQTRYMTEEVATVEFIELDIEDFAARADVTEAELRAHYEESKAQYTTPGRRRARHILIAGDDAAAEAKAKRAYERAMAGEDFSVLARELSDDAGSRESGGDLGEAQRADFVGPFADAVWSMTPGEIRGPVRTEFGWHVIKLESASPDVTRSFEEVRAELEPEFRRSQVEKAFGDAQEELDTLAFEAAGDLQPVAGALGRPIRRIERYTRAGSAEFAAAPQVSEAVFSPEVLAGRELRVVEIAPGKVVALAAKDHEPSRPRPLEEVRAEVVEAARLEAAGRLAAARAAEAAQALADGADWNATVAAWRGEARTEVPRALRRDDASVPGAILEAAFRAKSPTARAAFGTATLPSGDAAVWTVTAVEAGKIEALDAAARQAALNEARDRQAMSDATVYVTTMRANAEVDVNPQLFE